MRRTLASLSADKMAPVNIIAVPQMSFAAVSLIASSTMAIMITRTEKGLTTPYRRIIFGLSIADILQSVAALVGPISVTSTTPDSWGLGNDATCQTVGFLFTFGTAVVPKYTCFICWYYLCKLKYRMANDAFARGSEWKIHILIILYSFVLAVMALGWDLYNPAFTKTHCQIAAVPTNCRFFPDEVGECEPTIASRASLLTVIEYFFSYILCLIGMVVMMIMLLCHAYTFTKNLDPLSESSSQNSNHVESMEIEDIDDITSIHNYDLPDDGRNTSNPRENLRKLSKLYRDETVLQATCYVGSFTFVYLPVFILGCWIPFGLVAPKFFQIFTLSVYPSGGFFNVLVYTRPQVASLRRDFPEKSRLECLWLVLKAGGELPKIKEHKNEEDGPGREARMVDPSFSLPQDFETIETPPQPFVLSQRFSSNDLLPDSSEKDNISEKERNAGDSRKMISSPANAPIPKRRFYQVPSSFSYHAKDRDVSKKEKSEKKRNTGETRKNANAPIPKRRFYQMPSFFSSQASSRDISSTLDSGAGSRCLSSSTDKSLKDDTNVHSTNVKNSPDDFHEGVMKEENSIQQCSSSAPLSSRTTSSSFGQNEQNEKPRQSFYQWPPPFLSSVGSHDSIWNRMSSNNASYAVSSSALSYDDEEAIPDTNKFRTR